MQYQELLQIRKQKGMIIANTQEVRQEGDYWIVPSQSRKGTYKVILKLDGATCTCEDFQKRGIRCKHIFSVEFTITKQINKDGTTTITQTKKITYPQNWKAYTTAQNEEVRLFTTLLKDLVQNIEEVPQYKGRPKVQLRESIFCAIEKVYSQKSSRRAYSLYKEAEQKEQIEKAPSYNVINITLNKEDITPILYRLLSISALPLKSIETTFAIDSSGFRTTQFNEYCKNKYGTQKAHKWVKCHIVCGTKTNIITSASIFNNNNADTTQLIPLISGTANNGFSIKEVVADKAYSSRKNLALIDEINAMAYIPFTSQATGKPRGNKHIWRKMFHYFQLNQEEFMEHYHQRSNIESTFMAIKTKFGDNVRSKNFTAQTNELLCKLIAYNITVLISAMYELKIPIELN